jgi:signal transduction histidine kinase
MVDTRVIGSMSISFKQPQQFSQKDVEYMQVLAQQCAQALERARLSEQAQQTAAFEERNRIARDLHDAVIQTLFAASTIADSLPALWERNPNRMRDQLTMLTRLTRGAQAEMRTLLFELRPSALVNTKFSDLLLQLSRAMEARKNISFTLNLDEQVPLPPELHVTLYRLAQETLNNIVKHSDATTVIISFSSTSGRGELRIGDNGKGFDQGISAEGFGLTIMQERATDIGATLDITSSPGTGTEVIIRWQN